MAYVYFIILSQILSCHSNVTKNSLAFCSVLLCCWVSGS